MLNKENLVINHYMEKTEKRSKNPVVNIFKK